MEGTITPKPTLYRGVTFRSRLEARWAVFFDNVGLNWAYEPFTVQQTMAGLYLPDFHIAQLDCLIEVKPDGTEYERIHFADARWMEMSREFRFYALFGSPFDAKYRMFRVFNAMTGLASQLLKWSEFSDGIVRPSPPPQPEWDGGIMVRDALKGASTYAFY